MIIYKAVFPNAKVYIGKTMGKLYFSGMIMRIQVKVVSKDNLEVFNTRKIR
jgi:hypothetical protein